MGERLAATTRRRDMLRAAIVAGTTGAASVAPCRPAVAAGESRADKRRPQYQPNSAEVQTYYRVNRYPQK